MAKSLNGKRVAILVTDGFEQDELVGPREGLETAGAFTEIVSPKPHWVKGWIFTDRFRPLGKLRSAFAEWLAQQVRLQIRKTFDSLS
jgi:putative intracellular protease/amidase